MRGGEPSLRAPAQLWTAAEAAAADAHTIEVLGMPSPVLMERASLCVCAVVEGVVAQLRAAASANAEHAEVLVLVGPGNNGGDGLAVARLLHGRGYRVHAVMVTTRHNAAVAKQLELARAHGVSLSETLPRGELGCTVVVDALLGTGSRGAPRGRVHDAIVWLRGQARAQLRVVAVDLPSGVDVDAGTVPGEAVDADATVTFERSKPGLHLTPARARVGRLHVARIGLVEPPGPRSGWELIAPAAVARSLAALPEPAHKGQRGHVGVIGGTGGTPGAAILAGSAALRAGAGLATLAPLDAGVRRELIASRPELMLAEREDAWQIRAASVLVVGPGLVELERARLVMLERDDARPMVWDASALAHMQQTPPPGARVLTPHPGEAAAMLSRAEPDAGWSSAKVQADRREAARRLATHTGAVVVLKGAGSVVAQAESEGGVRMAICTTGSVALASAGTGDVLAGTIAGLLARGMHAWDAACVGVHLHGLAGERCASHGSVAMDVADALAPSMALALEGGPNRGWPSVLLG